MKKIFWPLIIVCVFVLLIGISKAWAQTSGLSISMSADKYTVLPGGEVGYTIKVKNNSSKDLLNLKLSSPIPSNATYVEGSINGGAVRDGKLWWVAEKIAAGQELLASFKLKAAALPTLSKPYGIDYYGAGAANRPVNEMVDAVAVAIRPQKSGMSKTFFINWIRDNACYGSYGCGQGGIFSYALTKANSNNMPSENPSDFLFSASGATADYGTSVLILNGGAYLEKDRLYFMMIRNTATNQSIVNGDWSSINTMMSPLKNLGDPGMLLIKDPTKGWIGWTSKVNTWASVCNVTEFSYKSFVGHGILWADGTTDEGYGYANSFIYKPDHITPARQIGEEFTWKRENTNITTLEVPLITFTSGNVTAYLEDLTALKRFSAPIAMGTPQQTCNVKDEPWSKAIFNTPIEMIYGHRYRLYLVSSGDHGQYIIWSNEDQRVEISPTKKGWQYFGLGGVEDYYIYREDGGAWRTDNWGGWIHPEATKMADLTFKIY